MEYLKKLALMAAVVGVSLVAISCGDSLPSAFDNSDLFQSVQSSAKLRHMNLLYGSLESVSTRKNAPVRLIIKFSDPTLDADTWLRRHTWLRRNTWLRRHTELGYIEDLGVSADIVLKKARKEFGHSKKSGKSNKNFDPIPSVLNDLLNDSEVSLVEPDIAIDIPGYEKDKDEMRGQFIPWGITDIGADAFRFKEHEGEDVDLYILDTRFSGEDLNLVEEKEFYNGGGSGDFTHGFQVAGIAAAVDNEEGVLGVAAGVRLHSFIVLNPAAFTDESVVIEALNEIMDRKMGVSDGPGAEGPEANYVVSLSLGADIDTTDPTLLDETITRAVSMGIVVVVSAGNSGTDAATYTPAHAEGAITVGAYDMSHTFAPFSNYGALVDIVAPGVDIVSLGRIKNGQTDYAVSSGTSMAVPHVSGAAAFYLSLHPGSSPAEVLASLSGNSIDGPDRSYPMVTVGW